MVALLAIRLNAEGKPVLQSTKDDRVFVYFADHGAVGLVAMPVGDPLYAQDLADALDYMWANDMYKELVFYMEACESGSMFQDLLPTDTNIYATTAANSEESSYGTYCGDESSVNGTVRASNCDQPGACDPCHSRNDACRKTVYKLKSVTNESLTAWYKWDGFRDSVSGWYKVMHCPSQWWFSTETCR